MSIYRRERRVVSKEGKRSVLYRTHGDVIDIPRNNKGPNMDPWNTPKENHQVPGEGETQFCLLVAGSVINRTKTIHDFGDSATDFSFRILKHVVKAFFRSN